MTPDVNVLVAAARSDHPHHRVARAVLEEAVEACDTGATLKLLPMVIASFLRLVTHPKVFVQPTAPADAVGFVEALLAVTGAEVPPLGAEWPVLRRLCLEKNLVSNSVPDAWLAAVVIHLGEHLVTFDSDFKKLLGRTQVTVLVAR